MMASSAQKDDNELYALYVVSFPTLYHISSEISEGQIAEEEKSNKMLKRKTGANLVGLKNWLEIISCQFRDLVF